MSLHLKEYLLLRTPDVLVCCCGGVVEKKGYTWKFDPKRRGGREGGGSKKGSLCPRRFEKIDVPFFRSEPHGPEYPLLEVP